MSYSKNKRFMALLLSILMTVGFGLSKENKQNAIEPVKPTILSYDPTSNTINSWKDIELDLDSLNKNLDEEDIIFLKFCSRIVLEFQENADFDTHVVENLMKDDFDKKKIIDFYNKKYNIGFVPEKLFTSSISELNDRFCYYFNIRSEINAATKLGELNIINYLDKNSNWDEIYEHSNLIHCDEFYEIERITTKYKKFELPNYGKGAILTTLTINNSSMNVPEKHLNIDLASNFEPYEEYDFINNDVAIRTKNSKLEYKEKPFVFPINSTLSFYEGLPCEYAILPEDVVIGKDLNYIKYKMSQWPLKNVIKVDGKKQFKPNYIDNQIGNQYKNPILVNYPLGAAKKRSGYRGR